MFKIQLVSFTKPARPKKGSKNNTSLQDVRLIGLSTQIRKANWWGWSSLFLILINVLLWSRPQAISLFRPRIRTQMKGCTMSWDMWHVLPHHLPLLCSLTVLLSVVQHAHTQTQDTSESFLFWRVWWWWGGILCALLCETSCCRREG